MLGMRISWRGDSLTGGLAIGGGGRGKVCSEGSARMGGGGGVSGGGSRGGGSWGGRGGDVS